MSKSLLKTLKKPLKLKVKLTPEATAALARLMNSDAAGIAHSTIYGFPEANDIVILGRVVLNALEKRSE